MSLLRLNNKDCSVICILDFLFLFFLLQLSLIPSCPSSFVVKKQKEKFCKRKQNFLVERLDCKKVVVEIGVVFYYVTTTTVCTIITIQSRIQRIQLLRIDQHHNRRDIVQSLNRFHCSQTHLFPIVVLLCI